jgi:hypothetical protein
MRTQAEAQAQAHCWQWQLLLALLTMTPQLLVALLQSPQYPLLPLRTQLLAR